MQEIIEDIKSNIARGDTSTAITSLVDYSRSSNKTNFYNESIMLSNRYNELSENRRNGTMRREEYRSELNRINFSLLTLVDNYVDFVEKYPSKPPIENFIQKFNTISSGLNGIGNLYLKKEGYNESMNLHIEDTLKWASTISFRDLKKEKKTINTYVDLDYYVVPKYLSLEDEISERINLFEIFNYTEKNIIILGQPGAGKTTTMKRLVYYFTNENIHSELRPFSHPIVIRLREWNNFQNKSIITELMNIYGFTIDNSKWFFETFLKSNSKVFFDRFINRLEFLLILDGLDELRHDLKEKLILELGFLSSMMKKSRIIVTSRPGENIDTRNNFKEFEICSLNSEQIKTFIFKWIGNSEEAASLEKQITNSPFSDTIKRPLTLGHLCALYERNKKIPVKPKTIYRKIINLLLEEWDDQRGINRKSEYGRFEPDRKMEFLSYLAFTIITNHNKISFSPKELEDAYKKICKNFNLPQSESKKVVKELESHTGIFIQSGYQNYEFAHKSIQEFLTAEYIVRLPSFPEVSLLKKIPAELALAAAVSINPTKYFCTLSFSKLLNEETEKGFFDIFFSRLVLEKPEFYNDIFLGISYLSTFSWVVYNTFNKKNIEDLQKIVNTFKIAKQKIIAIEESLVILNTYYEVFDEPEFDKIYLANTNKALGLNTVQSREMFSLIRFDNIFVIKQKKSFTSEFNFHIPQYLLCFN